MKKIFSILFIAVFAFILVGCGEKVSEDVEKINTFISTLPEVITIEFEDGIGEKIAMYEALTQSDKDKVKNYQKLTEAKNEIINLKNEAAAQIIIDLINSLDAKVTLADEAKYLDIKSKIDAAKSEVILKVSNKTSFDNKYEEYLLLKKGPNEEDLNKAVAVDALIVELPEEVSLDDKLEIQTARDAYAALTANQKALVTKLDLLVAKEAVILSLEKVAFDKEAALAVDGLIKAIPEVINYEDLEQITEARNAFDDLTTDQKAFVAELQLLVEKETAIDELITQAEENADLVIGLINEIPSPVKASDKAAIDAARNGYDQLDDYEKALVSNLDILIEKENEYNNLPASELTYEQRVEKAIEKITLNLSNNLFVNADLDFYQRDAEYGPTIAWTTNHLDIINSNGVYTAPLFDTDLVITYTATLRTASASGSIKVRSAAVSADEKWDMIETFLKYINKDRITNTKYTMYGYEVGYEQNPGEDLGFLMFYTGQDPEIIEDIVVGNPWVRTNVVKDSTEWIVIHDTGSGSPSADAYMHNNYIKSISGSSKSWHFTVDDKRIYQHLPTIETSWNAGDGGQTFGLLPTGVKAIGPTTPVVTIGTDGYFYLDNRKTQIVAPTNDIGQIVTAASFNATGIYTEVGEDGYYYMAKTHFNQGTICHTGGNKNSVSMETCVHQGSNYMMTMRKAAALTAMLLMEFDLLPDRVRQHNTFSGKNCPQTIRTAGKWDEFMHMVNVEYYGRKHLSDVTFEYLPKGNYFDSLGMVVNHPGNQTSISYDVKATFGGETRIFTYNSVIAGRAA